MSLVACSSSPQVRLDDMMLQRASLRTEAPQPAAVQLAQTSNRSDRRAQSSNELHSSALEVKKILTGEQKPPSQQEYKERLAESTDNWLFGNGLGQTSLNVGIAVLYPPYALYLLTNAGLQIAGFSGFYPIDILPDAAKPGVRRGYEEFISAPGRLNAGLFNKEFRD